jgi:Rrf2 family protein
MKLSRACGYALLALAHLARHGGNGPVTVDVIAAAEGLPESFLRKTLAGLTRAGVVLAGRGPSGGLRLARPARRITLLEVVEALDGRVRGLAPRFAAGDGARLDARLQKVCEGVAEVVRRRLRRVTVADLAGEGE